MTRLKGMDNDGVVFTVTVTDGQLTLSVPTAVMSEYDPISLSGWVSDNSDQIDEVCRVAMVNEDIESKEQQATATATKQVKK